MKRLREDQSIRSRPFEKKTELTENLRCMQGKREATGRMGQFSSAFPISRLFTFGRTDRNGADPHAVLFVAGIRENQSSMSQQHGQRGKTRAVVYNSNEVESIRSHPFDETFFTTPERPTSAFVSCRARPLAASVLSAGSAASFALSPKGGGS